MSCICRAVYGKWDRTRKGGDYHEPMDNPDGDSIHDVYNDPENHWAPFTERDVIR